MEDRGIVQHMSMLDLHLSFSPALSKFSALWCDTLPLSLSQLVALEHFFFNCFERYESKVTTESNIVCLTVMMQKF